MMWIMPLMFSVMFFFFPAGLVLYWLTNNILSHRTAVADQQAARRARTSSPPTRRELRHAAGPPPPANPDSSRDRSRPMMQISGRLSSWSDDCTDRCGVRLHRPVPPRWCEHGSCMRAARHPAPRHLPWAGRRQSRPCKDTARAGRAPGRSQAGPLFPRGIGPCTHGYRGAAMSLARREDAIAAIATATGRCAVRIVRVSEARPGATGHVPVRLDADRHAMRITGPLLRSMASQSTRAWRCGFRHRIQLHRRRRARAAGARRCRCCCSCCWRDASKPPPRSIRSHRQPSAARACASPEPGEFTERAFLNDKLDLAQAEAVADLIDASTEAAARSASRSFERRVQRFRSKSLARCADRAAAHAGRGDPRLSRGRGDRLSRTRRCAGPSSMRIQSAELAAVMRPRAPGRAVARGDQGRARGAAERRQEFSLLNALAGAELAIVTADSRARRATRSAETIQIQGVPIHVDRYRRPARVDDEAADEVERIGVARSWSAKSAPPTCSRSSCTTCRAVGESGLRGGRGRDCRPPG